jgi:hypothetical protein
MLKPLPLLCLLLQSAVLQTASTYLAHHLSADATKATWQQQAPAGLTATLHAQHAALVPTRIRHVLLNAQRAQLSHSAAPLV